MKDLLEAAKEVVRRAGHWRYNQHDHDFIGCSVCILERTIANLDGPPRPPGRVPMWDGS